ncbi:MAG: lysine--tRNA ligase, partial [Anaerolineae bacterium]|nr:lysine--tRNA ligase [Anaerolineae bacterium]
MEQDLSYFRDFGEQIEQRLDKLQNFAERGQAAYPPRVIRNHTAAEAITLYDEAEAALPEGSEEKPEITVQVAGRLVAIRIMGKSTFAHIEDGTGRIQIYLRKNDLDDSYDVFKKDVDLGDFIAVQGHLFRTRTGEVTVHADA